MKTLHSLWEMFVGEQKGSWGFYEARHESFIVDGMQRQKPAIRYLSYCFSRLIERKQRFYELLGVKERQTKRIKKSNDAYKLVLEGACIAGNAGIS